MYCIVKSPEYIILFYFERFSKRGEEEYAKPVKLLFELICDVEAQLLDRDRFCPEIRIQLAKKTSG